MEKKKILIIDDEMDMRTFLATLVEAEGYKPLTASDGLEGLQKAQKSRPALIIMDIMMPKESGIQLYRQLKTDVELKKIPVIVLSGLAKKTFFHSQKMLDDYMGVPVPEPEAYLEKPPEAEDLLAYINKLSPV